MTNSADLHPTRIPGYDGGLHTHQPQLLDEPLFWLGHLTSCADSEGAAELLYGADYDATEEFGRRLWERAEWPTFTVPLAADHRLHVVYRTFKDEAGVDYLLHHPGWDRAELLAQDDGHFMGPGLSWPELVTAAFSAMPGGSTDDPHARLLLLLPALGDDDIPDDAVHRLAAALEHLTAVEDPEALAELLLDSQGAPGPATWTTGAYGFAVNDGPHSYRNPANRFALPPDRMARVATALAP
ncbi:hypothetical protein G6045_25110 [Streptomyces sp. YC504]|uniref:Uncharacterized protein n=1 Tax=Streptomyces mesophilus TaxID=1775132 RepID=A0A6G4XNW4_9ACTN|nr:hypothetical protein [Streptomyces mesophilus]NGO78913.1 hypothetical protein [Streptomyces mesophilus]